MISLHPQHHQMHTHTPPDIHKHSASHLRTHTRTDEYIFEDSHPNQNTWNRIFVIALYCIVFVLWIHFWKRHKTPTQNTWSWIFAPRVTYTRLNRTRVGDCILFGAKDYLLSSGSFLIVDKVSAINLWRSNRLEKLCLFYVSTENANDRCSSLAQQIFTSICHNRCLIPLATEQEDKMEEVL